MIANFATILIGLWLVYRAIFSLPAGNVSQIELVAGRCRFDLACAVGTPDRFYELAQRDKYRAGRDHLAARRCAPGGWSRPTGIVLDDPPHWNHGGHHGGVVDSVSA